MTGLQRHILVVDDSADNRGLLVQLLEDDYRVSEAADGREALAVIAADRPDLVLLDLMMPVLDGFGVLEQLEADSGPFMPVVVVSAAAEREDRLRALRLGAHEFIRKPVDGEELQVRVATLLALKSAREDRETSLEAEVAARTAKLEAALARLEEADRYKDEFLSVISHELRTPLNFIMGFASVLEDEVAGSLNDTQHRHVSRILDGAERMLALVEDLLDCARMQAGTYQIDREPIDYASLIAAVASSLTPLADRKGITLAWACEIEEPVEIDGRRLGQVLNNLIDNAIKFTDAGTVTVRAFQDGTTVVTEVADTGVGIAAEDAPRLFQRFGQLDTSSTRRSGGTGLGLAIARMIVEAHGGTIGMTSEPDLGSVFRYEVPMRVAASTNVLTPGA